MKKLLVLALVLALLCPLVAQTAAVAEEADANLASITPGETELAPEDENYAATLFANEQRNYKIIRSIPTAFEAESWNAYCAASAGIESADSTAENAAAMAQAAADARAALVPVKEMADCVWFIWDDDMATTNDELNFDAAGLQDAADFRPYLVPYLLEDQSAVKGNLIVISGGGYNSRANTQEGYPTAAKFNELGYNTFVLQRRVAPYSMEDTWLDLQRSVRYLRTFGDEKGLGGMDCVCAVGYSGGSATLLGAVANLYGDVQPTVYDADYTCDEVDAANADLDVAIAVYGPNYLSEPTFNGLVTENPHMPAVLLIAGGEDATGTYLDNMTLFNSIKDIATVEMYTFAYAPHGFGIGSSATNAGYWPMLADNFMQVAIVNERDDSAEVGAAAEFGVIPEKYAKSQTYTHIAPFGPIEITCAVDEDEHSFIIFFEAFGDQQVIAGLLKDGIVTVKYDRTGFFGADTQSFFDGADPNAWVPVE